MTLRRHFWTAALDAQLVELRRSNSWARVAQIMGINRTVVVERKRLLGVKDVLVWMPPDPVHVRFEAGREPLPAFHPIARSVLEGRP